VGKQSWLTFFVKCKREIFRRPKLFSLSGFSTFSRWARGLLFGVVKWMLIGTTDPLMKSWRLFVYTKQIQAAAATGGSDPVI
jgi:hypothetical protein